MKIVTKKERFVEALLLPINPALVVLLGIYTVVWGIWLANPFWDVFSTAPLFSAMKAIGPEYVWGGIAIAAGITTIGGAVVRSYGALTRGSMVAAIHWLVIAIMYFMGDWQNTGGITAVIIALYASVVYWNIRINFRPDKRKGRWKMVHK